MKPYFQDALTTIYCGDCREILPQLTEKAALLWTDSAYDIESGGNTTKRMMGGIFDPAIYDNSGKLFATVPWAEWVPLAYAALREDADAVLMCNDKQMRGCLNAMHAAGFGHHNIFTWHKGNKTPNRWGMKSTEFLCYGWKGRARVLNDCGMGQEFYDRNPVGEKRHATEKPVSLSYQHIVNMTSPQELVLDCFLGSGSTGVAARRAGRRFIGIEIDEAMCQSAVEWITGVDGEDTIYNDIGLPLFDLDAA